MFEKYDAYKDSCVGLIGQIPENWSLKKLKFLTQVNASSLPENHPKTEIISYVDIGNVSFEKGISEVQQLKFSEAPSRARRLANCGDTVVSTVRTYLKAITYVDERCSNYVYSTGFAVLSPNEELIPKFLLNFVKSNSFTHQVDVVAKGMSYPAINSTELSNLWVSFPDIETQEKIVEFLDQKTSEIDQAIAIKEQQIALLNERKQIVIQKAVTQGLDPNVPMKDSGVEWIGQIPEHWEIIKVKNLFKLIIEPAPKNNDLELLSVYTDIGVKPRKELEERGNKASTTDGYWKVRKGDIIVNKLLAWMGAIGLSNYDGVTSPAYDILRAIKPLNPYIYHLLFRSPTCSAELKKHSRGIMYMRLRLYFDKFGDVLVPYAPITEQNEIIKYIEVEEQKINAGIELINQQIEKLKEYKTTLINDAVTGKIKVA